jgi:hypothetical protein
MIVQSATASGWVFCRDNVIGSSGEKRLSVKKLLFIVMAIFTVKAENGALGSLARF